jgi:hypothetical protein
VARENWPSATEQEDCPQENPEAVRERLELIFEQSRNGETYTPEQARQLLAERRAIRQMGSRARLA